MWTTHNREITQKLQKVPPFRYFPRRQCLRQGTTPTAWNIHLSVNPILMTHHEQECQLTSETELNCYVLVWISANSWTTKFWVSKTCGHDRPVDMINRAGRNLIIIFLLIRDTVCNPKILRTFPLKTTGAKLNWWKRILLQFDTWKGGQQKVPLQPPEFE